MVDFYTPKHNEFLRDITPDFFVTFLELFTHIGAGPVIILFAVLYFWFGNARPRDRLLVLELGMISFAVVSGIKGIFEVARPLEQLQHTLWAPESYGGYSFPSAHAMSTATFYFSMAAVLDWKSAEIRYAIAGIITLLVAYSRVVIGVHYIEDVIVGTIIGLLIVYAGFKYFRGWHTSMFIYALIVSSIAFLLGSTEYTTLIVGVSAGAALGWEYVKVSDKDIDPKIASIILIGGIFLVLFPIFSYAITIFTLHWSTEVLGFGIAGLLLFLLPIKSENLDNTRAVKFVENKIPLLGDEKKVSDETI